MTTNRLDLEEIITIDRDLTAWRQRSDRHAGETELLGIGESLLAEVMQLRAEVRERVLR
jgi:hypothetical protein